MLPSLVFLVSTLSALLCTSAIASPVRSSYPLTLADPRIPGTVEDLDGSLWVATAPSLGLSMPATVPGDVITDLFHAGVIPEPLYELNWLHNGSLWNDHTWVYNRTHAVSAARVASLRDAARSDDLLLVFDGIKMGADIYVNDVRIGRSLAQFERHVFSFRALLANKTTAGALQAGENVISVVFDPRINTELFMQCTGGWDWAPYSNTTTADGKQATFSRGIWKSVYTVYVEDGMTVTDTTPLVTYRGPYPTMPLSDGDHAGFLLNLTMHTMSVRAISANVSIQPSWRTTPITARFTAPAGVGAATVLIDVSAADILLWWPVGLGAQPLYDLDITVSTAASKTPLHITRRIGFRYFVIVTGNDTAPGYVDKYANTTGTDTQGMRFRINGAPIMARGANVIPMDTMEGRYTAAAHRRMVLNARDGGMNILRIWGGGIYLPSIFYATADEEGLMVYHDLMNRDAFTGLPDEVRAYRSTLRRLATHASIVIIDGCNECDANQGEIGTRVMSIATSEDSSRAVWPSCPAAGWASGVNRLTSHPDGTQLQPAKDTLSYELGVQLGDIEQHGPYQHGDGWPAVNGDNKNANPFDPMLPLTDLNRNELIGLGFENTFTSEFGSVGWSSFESVSPTVAPQHWALHGGDVEDTCSGGFASVCEGPNVMAQRNYPCDSIIFQYWGGSSADLDVVGEAAFKRQLYQCMLGQALVLSGYILQHRATNTYGLQIWQLNEIWPTGGWGTIEYGTLEVAGQVEGGRWKPAHYWLKDFLFTDRVIACGKGSSTSHLCYVRNDVYQAVVGNVVIYAVDLVTSNVTTHFTLDGVVLAGGPGVVQWMDIPAVKNPNTTILRATFVDAITAATLARNTILLTTPQHLALQPVQLTVTVVDTGTDATVDIYLAKKAGSAAALWVTLTTQAQGRFSENAFLMAEEELVLQFIPFGPLDTALLRKTLRVETANEYITGSGSSSVASE